MAYKNTFEAGMFDQEFTPPPIKNTDKMMPI